MTRPITLFTGQWADLPFEELVKLASGWGYDGLEIACWGDHLDVWQAAEDDAYVRSSSTYSKLTACRSTRLPTTSRDRQCATIPSTPATVTSCPTTFGVMGRLKVFGNGPPKN